MESYLDELNESQRQAVTYLDGPSLVIAGAGSGKTRVLTYKVAYLLEQGYRPWTILALTFTNKAAREMKERIARRVGEQTAARLWMGTFHSIFLRILHAEAGALGFSSHFTIYDASDSKSLIRTLLKEMKLDEKVYKPGLVQSRISTAKNRLASPEAYAADAEAFRADQQENIPLVRDIYKRYVARCRQADAMDFDDLLFYTYLLFRDYPDVLARYQQQFQFVLVDEYQDTNYAQHAIVKQLVAQHHRVCVVGDDAQSIYSFRGADIDNILHFTRTFPETRLFKLEQNYRSTQTIVAAANSLIAKNQWQIKKEVFSENARGQQIPLFQAYSDMDEASLVANRIASMHRRQQMPYTDFAILYRTNAQSRVFEETLRKAGMPYCIYGGLSFYQRKEIKDIISYFRLVVNPHDEEALKRIINYPARGIGETTLNKVIQAASDHEVSLYTVLQAPATYGLSVNKGTQTKLDRFVQQIDLWRQAQLQQSAFEAGIAIIKESGIYADLQQDKSPEGMARVENTEELVNGLKDFCAQRQEEGDEHISLSDYLSEVSLLSDQDTDDKNSTERITLMTVHSAKGLEFRNVFVVGLEENLFPGPRAAESPRALEEERRLFYVAITRAEEQCFLSYAKSRYRYGKMEFSTPSRFLRDIDPCCLDLQGDATPTSSRSPYSSNSFGSTYGGSYGSNTYSGSNNRINSKSASVSANSRIISNSAYGSANSTPLYGSSQPQGTVRNLKPLTTVTRRPSSVTPAAGSPSSAIPATGLGGLQVGQTIAHERFGIGQVEKVEGEGDNAKATIHFQNAGTKQLLLRFARFKIIDN